MSESEVVGRLRALVAGWRAGSVARLEWQVPVGMVCADVEDLIGELVVEGLRRPVFPRAAVRESRCARESGHEPHRWFDDRYSGTDPRGRKWCPGMTSAEECVVWAREREADERAARTWTPEAVIADHMSRKGQTW